jgi:hypothetical protein
MEAIAMTKTYLDYSFRLFRYCFITICFVSLLGCSDSLCWPLTCGGSTDSGADSEDGSPSLSIDDVSIKEGYGGSKSALFTIELQPAASEVVTVKWKTMNDSAEAGLDYTATNGTITFPIGITSKTVSISVLGDKIDEGEETFDVILYESNNAALDRDTGEVTITNAQLCNAANWCEGTYSTADSTGSAWTSTCLINNVTVTDYYNIFFHHAVNCGFNSIRAQDSVGSRWNSYAKNYDSASREMLIKHFEEKVFDALCVDAGGITVAC